MSVPQESNHNSEPVELAFDITRPSEQIRFLGLLDRLRESDNELTGLFDWTCPACGAGNRDAAILRPEQTFSAKWSCDSCSQTTVVRFHARASAEWVAQHTIAVTGTSFEPSAVEGLLPAYLSGRRRPPRNQAVFAWIAIPALLAVIGMELLDVRRVSPSSASTPRVEQEHRTSTASTPSTRIVGYWASEEKNQVVHFSPIDPVKHTGTYTVVSRHDGQASIVNFRVVQEEASGEQLVIRGESGIESPEFGNRRLLTDASDVTLYIPRDAKILKWVDVEAGGPKTTVYRNAGDSQGLK
jgi:hypothetical protein